MKDSCIRRVWARKGFSGHLLWLFFLPASCIYFVAVQLKNFLYSMGLARSITLSQAVVSVGNLTVGGTGKTPTTLWLAGALERRGLKVAVLSRGYKRTARRPVVLDGGRENGEFATAAEELFAAGDEPLMMARIFGCTVAVGKKRHEAARLLLQKSRVDVFILDDGFQYRRLKRDFDLVLLGADATGWVLPSGPFREPKKALRRADVCLITGNAERWKPLLSDRNRPAPFAGSLQPKSLIGFESHQWKERPLSLLDRSKILAVTAIGNPASFYRMIHDWEGEIVEAVEFPDHHAYSSTDWQRINRAARKADFIVTTEKDILKLIRFPFARDKLLALRIAIVVEDGEALIRKITDVIEKKNAPG